MGKRRQFSMLRSRIHVAGALPEGMGVVGGFVGGFSALKTGYGTMKRRDFIKAVAVGVAPACLAGVGFPSSVLAGAWRRSHTKKVPSPSVEPKLRDDDDGGVKSYLRKVRSFNDVYDGDVFLDRRKFRLLKSSLVRFGRVQKTVGFGNFYLLSFDEAVRVARRHTSVGAFVKEELDFLEQIFYERAAMYGFYGEKPLKNLTDQIPKGEVIKVPYTGNHLYRGKPLEMYVQLRRKVGNKMILTSGVRSVIKQYMLFLSKTYQGNGNLSRASRSLAPPGYSYHGISDFDVGQVDYGQYNFTERFVESDVFKQLSDLGVLSLRYPRDNLSGVRFEPWHVKVDV